MSQWAELDMDNKIAQILDVESHDPGHHFGRPFLTPYQIAIEFRDRYPQEFNQIDLPIGGIGTGQHNSLPQYIALELSKRISDGRITNIEGRFFHRAYLDTLKYKDPRGTVVESSLGQSYDLSMFRLN